MKVVKEDEIKSKRDFTRLKKNAKKFFKLGVSLFALLLITYLMSSSTAEYIINERNCGFFGYEQYEYVNDSVFCVKGEYRDSLEELYSQLGKTGAIFTNISGV